MALPTSGALSLNQIHVEAGGSSGTAASINDADIRALIGKASGATMSFSEWYGASAVTSMSYVSTTTASTSEYTYETVTTSSLSGDVVFITMTGAKTFVSPSFVTPYGSGITVSLLDTTTATLREVNVGKDITPYYSQAKLFYFISNATNKQFFLPEHTGNLNSIRVQVWRPSSSISSVGFTKTGGTYSGGPYNSFSHTIDSGSTAPILAYIGGYADSTTISGGQNTGSVSLLYDENGGTNASSASLTGSGYGLSLSAGYLTWS